MTDIPRCKTCKHWSQTRLRPTEGECDQLAAGDSKLSVIADEAIDAIETESDFGCTEHEEKP